MSRRDHGCPILSTTANAPDRGRRGMIASCHRTANTGGTRGIRGVCGESGRDWTQLEHQRQLLRESGYFSHSLNAYGRTGKPCPRCATPIRRVPFMNRSSRFCPRCQRKR